ncbi:hypothetical protein ERO13_D06G050750v2 [Gossypium hirsutum]|uniref:Uncharacterized protein isoform X4 n=1 Tax=Gossypium hirsutum TaxID=3635 RepID=A0ABM3A8J4_GOSHI|nr:uncharacterized protein LOC107901356 isoform X4 [Gossypium hirsutum]KAG4140986.1 hypothetical protein ERO13_D06G050750v2 [Gossypium hirsutum]
MSYFFFFCKTFFNIFPLHIPSKEKPSFPSLSPFFAIPTQCLVLANNASQYLSPTFIFDLPLFDDDVHLPVSKAITSTGTKKGEFLLANISTELKNKNITTNVKVDTSSYHGGTTIPT